VIESVDNAREGERRQQLLDLRTHVVDPVRVETWMEFIKQKGFKRVSIIAETTDYGIGLADETIAQAKKMPGIEVAKEPRRWYPAKEIGGTVIGRADIDHETVDRGLLSNCLVRLPDPGENASPPIRSRRCWNLRYYGGTCGVRETHRDRNRRRSALIGTNGATDQWHQKGNSRNAPPEPVKRPRLVCTLKN